MDPRQRVDFYLMTHQKYFPPESLPYLRDRLMMLPEDRLNMLAAVELKDPTLLLVISIIGGTLGIDRFFIGDIGMGVLKLLTGGLCGILWIVDLFLIQGKTRDLNIQQLTMFLNQLG